MLFYYSFTYKTLYKYEVLVGFSKDFHRKPGSAPPDFLPNGPQLLPLIYCSRGPYNGVPAFQAAPQPAG